MTIKLRPLSAAGLLLLAACHPATPGSAAPDASAPGSDAGPGLDAGSESDAGPDAGSSPDAGPSDAGPTDAGPSDAGATIPSCLQVDAGARVRLSVSGPQILDPAGAPIALRGWNWGAWGTATSQDAVDNAAQGANVVRLPVRWWGDYPDNADAYDPSGPPWLDAAHLCQLDQNISWAVNQHLWVVLFVDSNCGQGSQTRDTVAACGAVDGGAPANFQNDPEMKRRFTEAWAFLAARYAGVPYIGMYELLPEPNFTCGAHNTCPDWSVFPDFYASIIPAVRAADPDTPVLVGAGSAYDIGHIATAFIDGGSGIVYTGDLFEHAASDPASIAAALDFRTRYNAPVFIQQVGIRKSVADAGELVDDLLTQLDSDDLGWTWWTYREPNAPNGQGYAPYYAGPNGPWTLDSAWLQQITSHF